jgi:threonine synthase
MPEDTPAINQYECALAGAKTFLVNGLINDCGRIVREGKERMGWFDLSTLNEPYRIEGKKTMGLELAEQFNWELPDVILYPTGGGTGLIGMWKAFRAQALGWLNSPKLPRMVGIQSDGCTPSFAIRVASLPSHSPTPQHPPAASASPAVGDFRFDAIRASGARHSPSVNRGYNSGSASPSRSKASPFARSSCVGPRDLNERRLDQAPRRVVLFRTSAAQNTLKRSAPISRKSTSPHDWNQISNLASTTLTCSLGVHRSYSQPCRKAGREQPSDQ